MVSYVRKSIGHRRLTRNKSVRILMHRFQLLTMPRIPLNQYKPKTPLARLRREFLFHKGGKSFPQGAEQRFYQRIWRTFWA